MSSSTHGSPQLDNDVPVPSLSNRPMSTSVSSLPAALPSQTAQGMTPVREGVPVSPDKGHALARAPTDASLASTASASGKTVSSSWQAEFEKRFKHQLPASSPEDLIVIQTQSADLQSSILVHGRLYLTRTHLCFRANIIGVVTEKIHPLHDVTGVEKGTTAKWIQNAVYVNQAVVNDHGEEEDKHYGYGSMANRDTMYADLIENWRRESPNRYEKFMEHNAMADVEDRAGENGTAGTTPTHDTSRTANGVSFADGTAPPQHTSAAEATDHGGSAVGNDATEAKETDGSGERLKEVAIDTQLNLPLEQAFKLLYKNDAFTKHFYEVVEKLTELEITDWTKESGKEMRKLTYVMHMSNPIGPSQSSCWGTETVVVSDPKDSFEIESETHTPDLPSGKSFHVHTRTCLMHAASGDQPVTRVYSTTQVEWTGSSWLKGTITPAVIKGQKAHYKELIESARKWIQEHPDDFNAAEGVAVGGGKANDQTVIKNKAATTDTSTTTTTPGTGAVSSKSVQDTAEEKAVPQQALQMVEQVAEGVFNPATIILLVLCAVLVFLQYKGYTRGWIGGGAKGKVGSKELKQVLRRLRELEERVNVLDKGMTALRGPMT